MGTEKVLREAGGPVRRAKTVKSSKCSTGGKVVVPGCAWDVGGVRSKSPKTISDNLIRVKNENFSGDGKEFTKFFSSRR